MLLLLSSQCYFIGAECRQDIVMLNSNFTEILFCLVEVLFDGVVITAPAIGHGA